MSGEGRVSEPEGLLVVQRTWGLLGAILFVATVATACAEGSTTSESDLNATAEAQDASVTAKVEATIQGPPPAPTMTPSPTTTPPTQRTDVETFDFEAAMVELNDLPEGSVFESSAYLTKDNLPTDSAVKFADAWGLLRSYSATFQRQDGFFAWTYDFATVIYNSIAGAQRAVVEREEFLEASISDVSDLSISQVSMGPLGDQSVAFRLSFKAQDAAWVVHHVVIRRGNVIATISITSSEIAASFDDVKGLAVKLDSRIATQIAR